MNWYEVKRGGAILLATVNIGLLVWAIRAYRQKVTLPSGYFKLLPLSPVVAAMQLILGISFVGAVVQLPIMHIFYGVLVSLGAIAQTLLGLRTGLAERYKAKPLVHAFIALFVALLTARAWMAAR